MSSGWPNTSSPSFSSLTAASDGTVPLSIWAGACDSAGTLPVLVTVSIPRLLTSNSSPSSELESSVEEGSALEMTMAPLEFGSDGSILRLLVVVGCELDGSISGLTEVFEDDFGMGLFALLSPLASGELCKLLLRRRCRTLGGRGTSLRLGVPPVGVTDGFFADVDCTAVSRAEGPGFLNTFCLATLEASPAPRGVALVTEPGLFVLEGGIMAGLLFDFVCGVGCGIDGGASEASTLALTGENFLATGIRTSGDNLVLRADELALLRL